MQMRIRRRKGVRRFAVPLVAALLAATFVSSPARGDSALADCAEVMPVSELAVGMTGTGYTVVQGRDPQPFSVELLGVYPNGMGPGRDIIIVETSGPAIDEVGGIWFGMSGSPVYIGGKLVGAISLGLVFGTSPLAGVTPAEDMADVLDYPANTSDSAEA